MPQPSASPAPLASLRCTLDYPALDDFIARFGRNLSRAGLFLPMREPLEVGSPVRFEVVLADARVALRGEGVVSWRAPYEPGANDRLHGMGVRFTRLDGHSREVIERVMAHKAAHREEFFEPARDPVLAPLSPFAFVAPQASAAPAPAAPAHTPAVTAPVPAVTATPPASRAATATAAPVHTPAVTAPAPAVTTPAPVVTAPAPVATAPAPAMTAPAPLVTAPAPAAAAPAPAVTVPPPAATAPAPAVTVPPPAVTTPAPVAPARAAAAQPAPVASAAPTPTTNVQSPSQRTPVMSQRTPVRATQQSAETPRLRPTDSAQTPKIELPVPAAASGPRGLPSDSTRTPAQSARTPVNSARTPARSARTPIIALPPERAASAQATDDELTALSSPGGSRSVATNSPEGTRRLQDLLARRQGSGPASGKD